MFLCNAHEVIKKLHNDDQKIVQEIEDLYVHMLQEAESIKDESERKTFLISSYNSIGHRLQEFLVNKQRIHVYSFDQPLQNHGPISRVVAKLRDMRTQNSEFMYYTQRAFEFLFSFAFAENIKQQKNNFVISTPVNDPIQNYAVHKIPNFDKPLHNTTMCVLLRGALLPSLIIGKEIQEYSSEGYVPDYALFRISRVEHKDQPLKYALNDKQSFFDVASLQDKDLIIADPMNATGGSILTILKYFEQHNITPRSVKLLHIITSLQGALQVFQYQSNIDIYTLWVDPAMNDKAYILPGLGDAGDRINGVDTSTNQRNMIQLIANYGTNILQLYRAQIKKVEESILGVI